MKKLILYSILIFSLISCLDKIDFDTEFPDNLIVVDGTFTNSEETDIVKLSFALDYGKQTFVPVADAQLRIYENDGDFEELVETERGIYEFQKNKIKGVAGNAYHLEISLKDGRVYRSQPEKLKIAPVIDSFSYNVSPIEYTNDFGRIISSLNFNLSVQSTINKENQTDFLRWEVEHVYAFEQPYLYYIPFSTSAVCYVVETLDPQQIELFDGRNFATEANIKSPIATKEMDYTFGYAQSYRVSQYALSEAAYNYWANLNKVSNQVGNIFDAPPAPVKGNLFRVDDESELVLGYFGVAGVERSTLFITPGEIREFYSPISFCGSDPRDPREELPQPCYGCSIIQGSSFERPEYWP
ncbi:MAG: DUF4249 domain-containing protein [Bacteroidota bacterium]